MIGAEVLVLGNRRKDGAPNGEERHPRDPAGRGVETAARTGVDVAHAGGCGARPETGHVPAQGMAAACGLCVGVHHEERVSSGDVLQATSRSAMFLFSSMPMTSTKECRRSVNWRGSSALQHQIFDVMFSF